MVLPTKREPAGFVFDESRKSNAGAPLPAGMHPPSLQAGLGDNGVSLLCHSNEMFEDERVEPRKRFFRIADGAILA